MKIVTNKTISTFISKLSDKALTSHDVLYRINAAVSFINWLNVTQKLSETDTIRIRNELYKAKRGSSHTKAPLSSFPLKYVGFSLALLSFLLIGGGIYLRFFNNVKTPFAYSTAPVRAGRIISFQGRLTDTLGNPITAPIDITYNFYTVTSGGSPITGSTRVCTASPDQDGVFNNLIGNDVGGSGGTACNVELPSNIFSDNTNVYLGIKIGTEITEMSPRQQIANVGYAINAESLQGMPPGQGLSNIPFINQNGDMLIAASNPGLRSTYASTNFTISSAQATTIQSANGGDITLTASDGGALRFKTYNGALQESMTVLNTGRVGIGTTAPRALLDVNGNATVSGSLVASGQVKIGEFSVPPTTYGNGSTYYDSNTNQIYYWNGTAWTAMGSGVGATQYWQRTGGSLTPLTPTDDFNLGNVATASAIVHLPGRTNQNAFFNLGTGNLGIGTSAPTKLVDVKGDTSVVGNLLSLTDTRASGYPTQIQVSSANTQTSIGFTAGTANGTFKVNYNGDAQFDALNGFYISRGFSAIPFNIKSDAVDKLMTLTSGNVGIANTAPTQPLDVTGNVRFSGALMPNNLPGSSGNFLISGGPGASPTWTSTVPATSIPFSGITSATNTTATMVVGAGGSLNYTSTGTINASSLIGGTWASPGAIGTTAPAAGNFTTIGATTQGTGKFTTLEAINTGNALTLSGVGANIAFSGAGLAQITTASNQHLALMPAGTGNVGIGTTAPTSKLQIVGAATGNILALNDGTSDVVTVSSAQSTFNNPTAFTSAGDVSFAYDVNFTNATASYIKSIAPLYVAAGETFNSSDLTLKTYNSGDIVLDAGTATSGTGSIGFYDSNVKSATVTTPIEFASANTDINSFRTNFASSQTIIGALNSLSSGGSGSLWTRTLGSPNYVKPTNANDYLYPNGTADIGASGTRWTNVFATNGDLSGKLGVGYAASAVTGGVAAFNGNVGIGNTTPTTTLDVTGTGKFSSTLTASNGLTQTTGATSITGTSGALTLSGLTASSINSGANDITFTSGHFNTTATGINTTAIGVTTAAAGNFTTIGASSLGTGAFTTLSANSTGNALTLSGAGANIAFSGAGLAQITTLANNHLALMPGGTGNVGIGTSAPAAKLDVAGDIRSTNSFTRSLTRTLPIVVNDEVDIGDFAFSNGGGTLWVSVTIPSTGFSVAKTYMLPIQYAQAPNNVWVTALPISSTGAYSSQDVDLDVRVNNGTASLRLRRKLGTTAGTAYILIKQEGINTDTFTASVATSSTSAPTAYFTSTTLTQVGGNVGIGNNGPGSLLDIGLAGTTLGTLRLEGNTSGYTQIQPSAAAGSWTMTLPGNAGTNGYVMTTNGSGTTTWTDPGSLVVKWNSIGNPTGPLSLTMGANTSTFTYNGTTGPGVNLFNLTDTASNTGTGYLLNVTTAASSALHPLRIAAAGTEALFVDTNARVGLGNTAPGTTLDVTGTGRFSSTLTASNGLTQTTGATNITGTSGALSITGLGASTISTTSNNLTLSTVTGGTLALTSAGALNLTSGAASTWTLPATTVNALNIGSNLLSFDTTNSRVGIGTSAPGAKLELTSGDLYINSNNTASVGLPYLKNGTNYGASRNNSLISMAGALSGRLLNRNAEMLDGTTGYAVYDNSAGGHTTISAVASAQAPNSSGQILRVSYDGTGTPGTNPTPGFGGFYVSVSECTGTNNGINGFCYREGNRYLVRIWANLPTTRNIQWASNGLGTGGNFQWLTSRAGTGNWVEYDGMLTIGIGGSPSSTGYWYADNSGANSAFTWDVASVQLIGLDETPSVETASNLNIGYLQGKNLAFGELLNTQGSYLAVSGGSVGIGNTGPGTKLDVTGVGRFSTGLTLTAGALNLTATSGLINATGLGASTISTTSNNLTLSTVTGGTLALTSAGALNLTSGAASTWTLPATTVNALNIGSNLLSFDTTNSRVGIGTSAPGTTLDVTGTGRFSSTLTASNGLTQTTGATNITGTSGALTLSGLTASSINSGANDITFTSGHFNTTATGINTTAIGVTTAAAGNFTTIGASSLGTGAFTTLSANATGNALTLSGAGANIAFSGAGLAQITTLANNHLALMPGGTGNVGVGTSAPDANLSVNGSIANLNSGDTFRVYRNVASFNSGINATGTVMITMPTTWSNTMISVKITGYDYSTAGAWEIVAAGYNYAASTQWINTSVHTKGRIPFSSVRLAYDTGSSKNVILLGTTSTVLQYPKISVSEVLVGYSAYSGWGAGWATSQIVSEATITNSVTPTIDVYTNPSGLVGIGTTGPGQKLDVAGNLQFSGALMPGSTAGTSGYFLISQGAGVAPIWTNTVPATSLPWSSLTNPTADLSLTMNAWKTTFTYNGTTGAGANLFNLTDTASNTGTGYLLNVTTAASSALHPLRIAAAGTEALFVDTNARVGLGNTAPGTTLDVTGTGRFSSTLTASNGLTQTTGATNITGTSGALSITGLGASTISTTSNNLTLSTVTGGTLALTSAGALNLTSGAASTWTLPATTVNALNIGSNLLSFDTTNSRVGIGTSAPGTTLDVTGTGRFSSTLTASNGLTQTTGATNITGTSGALTLSGLTASSINSGANDITFTSGHFNTTATGINTTAIGVTTAAAGNFTTIGASSLGTGAFTTLSANSTGNALTLSGAGANIAFSGAGLAQITTLANNHLALMPGGTGNVGIGTTAPGYKLDVTGDINTSGRYVALEGAGVLNYVKNGGFEGGFQGTSPDKPIEWTCYGTCSGFTNTDETGAGNFHSGAHSLKVVATGASDGVQYTVPGLNGGEKVYLSYWVKVVSGSARVSFGPGGSWEYDATHSNAAWTRYSGTFTVTAGDARLILNYGTTGTYYIDDVQIEVGNQLTAYKPFITDINGNGRFDGNLITQGNVGIGTTAPTAKLDVNGNLNVSTYATVGASLALGTSNAAAGPGNLDMSGNLTLSGAFKPGGNAGTSGYFLISQGAGAAPVWTNTVPATSLPWNSLTNPTGPLSLTMGANTSTFTYNGTTGPGVNLFNLTDTASNTGTGYLLNVTTAASSALHPLRVAAAGTEALFVDTNARVGLGNTAPTTTLDVTGTGKFSSTLTASNGLTQTTGATSITGTSGALSITGLGASTISTTSNNLTLSTVTAGTLALTSAGALNLTSGAASTWTLPATTVNALNIGSNLLSFDTTNSRVGVGTSAPASSLDIYKSITHTYPTPGLTTGTLQISPSSDTNDDSASITFGANGAGAGRRQQAEAGIYVQSSSSYGTKMYFGTTNSFATGSQIRMMIDHSGNVGIGTTTPTAKLDVNGNLNVSTYATVGASLALGTSNAAAGPGNLDMSGNLTLSGAFKPGGNAGTSGYFLISGGAGAPPTWTNTVPATSIPFSGITSGTNTTAAMIVGSGASLTYNGGTAFSGGINANYLENLRGITVFEALRGNNNMSGGGTLAVDASYNVSWTTRFIVISNGRGTTFSTNGYFDIAQPAATTAITGVGGAGSRTWTASGVLLNAWEALYYILPIGSTNTSIPANFRIAAYTSDQDIPADWVLVAVRNGENNVVKFSSGVSLLASQSYVSGSYSTAYAPNSAQLLGSTWAIPGAIGSTTPNTGAFTTLTASNTGAGALDVAGGIYAGTTNAFQVDVNGNISTTGTTGLTLSGAGADINFTGTGPNVISTTNAVLGLMTGTGNVGIGTTAPGTKFDISGGIARQNGYLLADAATNNLVANGDFEQGYYGWSTTGVTPVIVAGGWSGNNALQFTGASGNFLIDDYIPVNPTQDVFELEVYLKKTVAGGTPGLQYFGYIAYDSAKTAITTAPCGTYCYFAASGYVLPVDGNWHKFNATTTGEGTVYPNFPVGTKYVRVLGLINNGASADAVTLVDHVTLRRINNGPLFVGNNFTATNLLDQTQLSKIYTTSTNALYLEPPSTGTIILNTTGNVGIGTSTPTTFKLEVAGSIGPEADNTRNLGGVGRAYNTLYVNNIVGTGAIGYWNRTAGVLNPATATDKLAIGGSTSAAPFYVTDTGVVSFSTDVSLSRGAANRLDLATGDSFNLISGNLNTDSGNLNVITTASAATNIRANGMLLGNSYDTTPVVGEVRTTSNQNLTLNARGTGVLLLDTADTERWRITNAGILQSNGAQTIQTSTGNLTLATAAGNGHIILTPNGTGNVGIGTTGPTAKLDIQGSGTTAYSTTTQAIGNTDSDIAELYNANASSNFVGLKFSSRSTGSSIGRIALVDSGASTGDFAFQLRDGSGGGAYTPEKMRITSLGNVGIGTTAPGYKLDVSGDINLTGALRAGANAYGTTGFLLTSAGGSTNTWTDPATILSAANYWNIANGSIYPKNATLDMFIGGTSTASAHFAFLNSNSGTATASISGTIANVNTFIDGNGNIATTNRQNLVLGNSATYNSTGNILLNPNGAGNVGIGTTGPTANLHVYNSGNASALFQGGGISSILIKDPGTFANINTYNDGTLRFFASTTGYDSTSNQLVLKSGGNVGIGTTNPLTKFHTVGSDTAAIGLIAGATKAVRMGANSTYAQIEGVDNTGTGSYQPLYVGGSTVDLTISGARKVSIDTNGNVGIGTTGPGEKFSVVSADNTAATNIGRFLANNLSQSVGIGYQDVRQVAAGVQLNVNAGTSGILYLGNASTGGVNIAAAGGNVNFPGTGIWNSAGNVGIGTTGPIKKLEVAGDILNQGILYQKTNLGQGSGAHGISWYDPSFYTWFDYMAPPGTTNAPSGTAAPTDAASGVTNWARRFNIENVANYGWIFESGGNGAGSAPTVKFAINSNNGDFHAVGRGLIDGNLGIGTTNPGAKLEIDSAATEIGIIKSTVTNQQGWLRFDGNGTTRGYVGWDSSGGGGLVTGSIGNSFIVRSQGALHLVSDTGPATNGITITSGNVGVGTTAPNASLHVSYPSTYLNPSLTYNAPAAAIIDNWGAQLAIGVNSAGNQPIYLQARQSANVSWPLALNPLGGNVGVGTTNPGYLLDVSNAGSLGVTNKTAAPTNSQSLPGSLNLDGLGWNTSVGSVAIKGQVSLGGTYAAGTGSVEPYLAFSLKGTGGLGGAGSSTLAEYMRITNAGNVGIGTTAPGAKLDTAGMIRTTSYVAAPTSGSGIEMFFGTPDANTGYIQAYDRTGSAYKNLALGTSGTQLYLKSDGNVGIGTTAPSYVLDVSGGAGIMSRFSGRVIGADAVNTNEFATLGQISGGAGQYWQRTGGSLAPSTVADDINIGATATSSALVHFPGRTNQSVFFTGLGTGGVGIGNTAPSQPLDVTGNVKFSGALMPNNLPGTSGNFLISGGAGAPPTWTSTVTATSLPFSGLTSATNTTAAMVVGAGASLNFTSTGTINASTLLGNTWAIPGTIGSTTPNSGVFTTLTANNTGNALTLAGGGANIAFTGAGLAQITANNQHIALMPGTGNVGIGLTAPTAKLHSLATTEQLRLGYDTSNYNSFTVGSTGSLTIAATGTNPNIILTPGGTGNVQLATANSFTSTVAALNGGTLRLSNGRQFNWVYDSNTLALNDATAGNNNLLYFNSSGNVGVGTSAPAAKLDVNGDIHTSGYASVSASLSVGNTGVTGGFGNGAFSGNLMAAGTTGLTLSGVGANLTFSGASGVNQILTASGIHLALMPGGTGNVGIGTTTPGAKLDLAGTLNVSSYATMAASLGIGTSAPYGNGNAQFAGLVGIGTTVHTGVDLYVNNNIQAKLFQDAAASNYFISPGNGAFLSGHINIDSTPANASAIQFTDSSKVMYASISAIFNGGDPNNTTVNIAATGTTTLCVGNPNGTMCDGKIDAGTVDPPYTINGSRYATYVPSMTGVKEETTGQVALATRSKVISGYEYTIDFNAQTDGSDLWLFSKTTALRNRLDRMSVLLSPTDNARTWYKIDSQHNTLTLYASRPTTISYRLTAPRFDDAKWKNVTPNGSGGFIVNDPDQPSTAIQIDGNGNVTGQLVASAGSDGGYRVLDEMGAVVEETVLQAKTISAHIVAGLVEAQKIVAPLAEIDVLHINTKIQSPIIETDTLQVNQSVKTPSLTTNELKIGAKPGQLAQLVIKGLNNNPVAQIDEQGNATFAGTLASQTVTTGQLSAQNVQSQNASISGTLIAKNIQSDTIDALANQIASSSSTLASNTSDINAVQQELANLKNQPLPNPAYYQNIDASYGNLTVNNTANIYKATIADSLMVGTLYVEPTSILALSNDLRISSLSTIHLFDDAVVIAKNGDIAIKGEVSASSLAIKNTDGVTVASIDASGSARFNEVIAKKFTLDSIATQGAIIANSGVLNALNVPIPAIKTNAEVAGTGSVPQDTKEVIIYNNNVTQNSLVYLTPTAQNIQGQLSVIKKVTCPAVSTTCSPYFIVSSSSAIHAETPFNWLIIN